MAGMQVRIISSYYIIATITLGEPEETKGPPEPPAGQGQHQTATGLLDRCDDYLVAQTPQYLFIGH
jgi:hypothetical protein